ncbi:condensation domain-containing protein [Nocardia asteroides]|uniref:condensation domain-containing protein n=1 Tax=Nocardia asteroides TaxID=1824 RepID=UPI001E2D64E7|nr:condensation domain-containing protein [Nocardia asteroides]UGT62270.1 condensation domain-containing protein [Nocardia asteroides]
MIITALANWNPPAGSVFEWHPAGPPRAEPDPGRASFLQENHVRGVAAGQHAGREHHAYLATATEVAGELEATAMSRAVERFSLRHAGLRTWLEVDNGAVTRMRVPESAVAFEVRPIGETEGGAAFREYALARFSREAIVTSYPGFAVGAVRRPGSFTLYYGCDHALSDGISQALVLPELLELYRAEATGAALGPFTSTPAGGFPEYAAAEHALAAEFGPESREIAEWLEIVRHNDGALPSCPVDLGLAPGETAPMRPIEFDLLDADGTAAFDAVCKSEGVRFVAGVLAAVAVADLEIAGKPDYYGMIVTSTRDRGDYLLSQGWFCNFAPVAFPVRSAGTFRELLAHAHAGYERALRLAAAPVQSVITALLMSGADPAKVAASPNMLSYIDFRRFPGAGSSEYEHGMLFTGEGATGNASLWINRDRRHLYLGCQSPGTPAAQAALAPYHARLREVFAEVARDGDRAIRPREVIGAGHHR